jgi:hypothetical protein
MRCRSRSVRRRKEPRSAGSSAAGVFRSLFRWDGFCAWELFTHARPDHRSLPRPTGAWEASRQEPLRFIRREPCGGGASQPDRAVDGKTNAALPSIFAADGENIPNDGLIPAQYGQIIPADEVQRPDDEQISSSIAGGGRIGPGMEKKIPVAHGKIPVRQAKKTDGRCPVRVSDSRRLGREENRLVGRKNEPVRWGSASPGRSSGGEQKHRDRHQRLTPCFRGAIGRMRESRSRCIRICSVTRWRLRSSIEGCHWSTSARCLATRASIRHGLCGDRNRVGEGKLRCSRQVEL